MATVYRALDRDTNEWVAVKVLLDKHIGKDKIRKRFATEAKAMMRLRHRNVCAVLHLNADALQPYFAMELAQGGCVVEWLAAHGRMPPKMAVDVAIQVCKGLGAAHRQGVIHRDVKPHNILVNRRGVCKITDFGIAQLDDDAASLTRTGSVMGTLGYIAPEQRTNAKDVDERSDVYSVGATLYTMLTARTTMDLFFADQEPEMMKGVHEVLAPIVMKATRYRREERHGSMRQLAKELYHAKAQLPEDPVDTPSLIMNSLDELTDELEMMTGGEQLTADTPFSALSTAETPAPSTVRPNEDPTLGMLRTPRGTPSTTPGIPRAHLLRVQEDEDRVQLRKKLAMVAAIASVPVLLVLLVVGGLALSGRSAVVAHLGAVEVVVNDLNAALEAEAALPRELIDLGANRAVIEAAWLDWQSVSGRQRIDRVEKMLALYRKQLGEHQPISSSPRVHLARSAEARLGRLAKTWDRADRADRALEQTASGAGARLAMQLGLVTVGP